MEGKDEEVCCEGQAKGNEGLKRGLSRKGKRERKEGKKGKKSLGLEKKKKERKGGLDVKA